MKIDSTAVHETGRITGTLHKREYVYPAPLRDEHLPKEKTEESEVAGRHKYSGQKDHKGQISG